MLRVIISVLLVCWSSVLFSQGLKLGLPFIKSYPKENYQAAAQNSDILQDERGIMYFANADGLLSFDASSWKLIPLPNKSILRTIELGPEGNIYAGGQNEFGVFIPDATGNWEFHSLKHLIPAKHRDFSDVWNIHITTEGVFFRSSGKLFQIKGDFCKVYDQTVLSFLGENSGNIYVQGSDGSLFKLAKEHLVEIPGARIPEGDYLTGIENFNGTILLSSFKGGFYKLEDTKIVKWRTMFDAHLRKQEIRDIEQIGNKQLAIATSFGGLLIMEADRREGLHLRKQEGLLRNRILCLLKDNNSNLWLGLDYGINQVLMNSSFRSISPDPTFQGIGSDIKVFGNSVFFGTNNGLYWTKLNASFRNGERALQIIPGTRGETWGLDIIAGKLMLSHNMGGFVIDQVGSSFVAKNVYDKEGVWTFRSLWKHPDIVVAGTYEGISFFKQDEGKLTHLFKLPGFLESSRFLEQDTLGNVWVAHPYRGIYRIEIKEDLLSSVVHAYGQKDGLPSDLENHMFKVHDTLVFCGEKGVYLFDYATERFVPHSRYNELFGENTKIRRLLGLTNGDLWFISQEEFGLMKAQNKEGSRTYRKHVFPEIETYLNKGYEKIYETQQEDVFITTEQGFVHFDPSKSIVTDTVFRALIREVRLLGDKDSLIFAGIAPYKPGISSHDMEGNIPKFSYEQNAFHFEFSATDFASPRFLQYRYKLEGFDHTWTPWTSQRTKEYTNLPPKGYRFVVQAKNHGGEISEQEDFTFLIRAPWYANTYAYMMYFLVALLALTGFYGLQQKKYVDLKEDHKKVIDASEKEIGKLKEEKAETELSYKQRALTTATMHLVQKKEMLEAVKTRLTEIRASAKEESVKAQVRSLLLMLRQDANFDDGWEKFVAHFNEVNENFFDRLKEKYPKLTPKDLRLCAYLRMNLSTKEMASLLNVTVRGIEASRYRLRKKIGLSPEINLTEFLMAF